MKNLLCYLKGQTLAVTIACVVSSTSSFPAFGQRINPNQAQIESIEDETALLVAKTALEKAKTAQIKEEFSPLPSDFGKKGQLTIEGDKDKFHIASRVAESFTQVAKKIAAKADGDGQIVLLSDTDRHAMGRYISEKIKLERVVSEMRQLVGPPPVKKEASTLAIGMVLSLAAQLSQAVRNDKTITFLVSDVPEQILLDLIAVEDASKFLYPAGALDAAIAGVIASSFSNQVHDLFERREMVVKLTSDKILQNKAIATLTEIDALANRLISIDPITKVPDLHTIVRGELSQGFLDAANGQSLSIKIVAQGGTSLKTSSMWRSDRLYTAGGVVISYRISGEKQGRLLKAGIINEQTKFVPLLLEN